MKIEEVHFNHDINAASSDALTICKNAAAMARITAPEWKAGQAPQPAAYASAALATQVTIKAKFSGGPPDGTRKIRAISAPIVPMSGLSGWIASVLAAIFRALFGSVLGDVRAKTVSFGAAGNSGVETFELINHRLKTAGVGVHHCTWTWQVKQGWKWVDFANTAHKIYLVLDIPHAPWQQNVGNVTQLPWADALDKACVWANGSKTKDHAAAMVTKTVNGQPRQSYTPSTMFGFNPPYQLASYINHLDSGLAFKLNCTDCADAVTTFANLLGCDLLEGRFFNMVTRRFLPLNGNPANDADWASWSWGYHEICWLHAMGQSEFIYDGCLQVDMDNNYNDQIHIAQNPIRMKFGTNGPNDYRYRLIQSGTGNLENIPRHRSVA
jgi:hypothetical protein